MPSEKRYNLLSFLEIKPSSRFSLAKTQALEIAKYLQKNYNSEVWGIGSLFQQERIFTDESDIDLVVSNLPPLEFFKILVKLDEMSDFELDVIPLEQSNKLVKKLIAGNELYVIGERKVAERAIEIGFMQARLGEIDYRRQDEDDQDGGQDEDQRRVAERVPSVDRDGLSGEWFWQVDRMVCRRHGLLSNGLIPNSNGPPPTGNGQRRAVQV